MKENQSPQREKRKIAVYETTSDDEACGRCKRDSPSVHLDLRALIRSKFKALED